MTLKVLQPKSYNTPVMQKVFVRGYNHFKVTKNGVLKLICIFFFLENPNQVKYLFSFIAAFRRKVKIRTKSCNKKIDKL